jgi:hypothetical protein
MVTAARAGSVAAAQVDVEQNATMVRAGGLGHRR